MCVLLASSNSSRTPVTFFFSPGVSFSLWTHVTVQKYFFFPKKCLGLYIVVNFFTFVWTSLSLIAKSPRWDLPAEFHHATSGILLTLRWFLSSSLTFGRTTPRFNFESIQSNRLDIWCNQRWPPVNMEAATSLFSWNHQKGWLLQRESLVIKQLQTHKPRVKFSNNKKGKRLVIFVPKQNKNLTAYFVKVKYGNAAD